MGHVYVNPVNREFRVKNEWDEDLIKKNSKKVSQEMIDAAEWCDPSEVGTIKRWQYRRELDKRVKKNRDEIDLLEMQTETPKIKKLLRQVEGFLKAERVEPEEQRAEGTPWQNMMKDIERSCYLLKEIQSDMSKNKNRLNEDIRAKIRVVVDDIGAHLQINKISLEIKNFPSPDEVKESFMKKLNLAQEADGEFLVDSEYDSDEQRKYLTKVKKCVVYVKRMSSVEIKEVTETPEHITPRRVRTMDGVVRKHCKYCNWAMKSGNRVRHMGSKLHKENRRKYNLANNLPESDENEYTPKDIEDKKKNM